MHQGDCGLPHSRPRCHDIVGENHGFTTIMTTYAKGSRNRGAPICTPEALVTTPHAFVYEERLDSQAMPRPRCRALE
jgi:hypothetical protein